MKPPKGTSLKLRDEDFLTHTVQMKLLNITKIIMVKKDFLTHTVQMKQDIKARPK